MADDMADKLKSVLNNPEMLNMISSLINSSNENSTSDFADDDSVTTSESLDESNSPHYESFFSKDRYKTFRRNSKDIKIIFGNGSIVKTIKNVFMRSVNVEVDTSGNPISEVYEFIAQDVKESDEISDAMKYNEIDEEVIVTSNIKYVYPFATNSDSNNENLNSSESN